MIRFYTDVNVEGAIIAGLRLRGIDVLTAQQDGHANTPDAQLLDRAGELERALITEDKDFLIEAARRQREGLFFFGVLFARKNHIDVGRCIDDLVVIANVSEPDEYVGRLEYIPL